MQQTTEDFIGSNNRGVDYFSCVPQVICPDNPKIAVNKTCKYEPELNYNYQRFAEHYGTAIVPARVRKPKDKAKVEGHVLIAKRWVLAVLRDRIFFSLDELNEEAARLREVFNNKVMQKIGKSRWQLFKEIDKPNAIPLPAESYGNTRWKPSVRLHIDYHFEIDKYFYSAPYTLRGQLLKVKITEGLIEAFHNNERVACHKRLKGRERFSTNSEHMPESHKKYVEWNSDRILNWAAKVGPHTKRMAKAMLDHKSHPRQAYRAILGVINLNKHYPSERIEKAAERALYYHQYSYASLKRILESKLDKSPLPTQAKIIKPTLPSHENIRGREYYQQ
jgi:transposase